jgi:large subunit ribosomal protein L19
MRDRHGKAARIREKRDNTTAKSSKSGKAVKSGKSGK